MRPPPDDVAAIADDPDALEAFYREHLPTVRTFLARRLDDSHAAADLTADVFVAAIESAHRYSATSGTPAAWLLGIARNVMADHVRRRARELRATSRISGRALLDEAATERINQRIDGERAARAIYRSLDRLPPRQRAVVELVAVDGLSLTEAAAALGISPGNARVRYHRARTRLQSELTLSDPEVIR